MIKNLSISGFRGFGKKEVANFAQPNGNEGSGLTFLVGSNNSGKTTILEALDFFNFYSDNSPSIAEKKRNTKTESMVELVLTNIDNDIYSIVSDNNGGSVTHMSKNSEEKVGYHELKIFTLQSRRFVDYEFFQTKKDRDQYIIDRRSQIFNRSHVLKEFSSRLFNMYKNKDIFDPFLKRILGHDLKWTIEQNDNGRYYIKLEINGCIHSSEGLGDGIWSVFTICDALFDSQPDSIITIDEPELSMHPAYQKRTLNLLKEYAKDRQIIISTHSPYFIDWNSIINGANLIRTVKNEEGDIEVKHLSDESKENIKKFLGDICQPHTLGIEAKEVFFLEDNIILVEGQEDAVIYPLIAKDLGTEFKGNIFGWGVGGAGKMEYIIRILKDLGYKKVSVIFDGDKLDEKEKLEENFKDYKFFTIPADDIRDKPARNASDKKEGIVDNKCKLKDQFKEDMKTLIEKVNNI